MKFSLLETAFLEKLYTNEKYPATETKRSIVVGLNKHRPHTNITMKTVNNWYHYRRSKDAHGKRVFQCEQCHKAFVRGILVRSPIL